MMRTSSTRVGKTAQGMHTFEVAVDTGLGVGACVTCDTFAVGGHDWRVCFYPRGADARRESYVAVFLDLVSKGGVDVQVQVLFDFRLLNWASGVLSSMFSQTKLFKAARGPWGTNTFMQRGLLEASYLQDDRILIECEVTVVKQSLARETVDVRVPPSDLMLGDLGRLLKSEVGADVAFKVKGEVFHAHKIILSVRSPVFKELLYASTSETKKSVTIDDMVPVVFKALLRFIYTDSLPAMGELDGGEKNEELVWHLLVAAEKYAVERMKLICEEILCKQLDGKSVASILALADKHHCSGVRDACVEFMRRECPAVS